MLFNIILKHFIILQTTIKTEIQFSGVLFKKCIKSKMPKINNIICIADKVNFVILCATLVQIFIINSFKFFTNKHCENDKCFVIQFMQRIWSYMMYTHESNFLFAVKCIVYVRNSADILLKGY